MRETNAFRGLWEVAKVFLMTGDTVLKLKPQKSFKNAKLILLSLEKLAIANRSDSLLPIIQIIPNLNYTLTCTSKATNQPFIQYSTNSFFLPTFHVIYLLSWIVYFHSNLFLCLSPPQTWSFISKFECKLTYWLCS